jgi:Protein of unknown function (DUF3179)
MWIRLWGAELFLNRFPMNTLPSDAPLLPPAVPPKKLLTFSSGGWVLLLALALTLFSAGIVLLPVYQTGFRSAVGDGQHVETYGFDLSNLTVPREQIVATGKAKDEVRAVPESLVETLSVAEVELKNKHEYTTFLVGSDRVIGVVVGKEARAYPVRFLNLHEVVNDRLGGAGGEAIAVTWGALSGSAVVFERENGTEFGVSGLVYQSNLLMFDRQGDGKKESLWSQLGFRALSGPAVGKGLKVVPFELTTWGEWCKEHPETRVFEGLRTLKQAYTDAQDPFDMYLANDGIRFPVSPLWPHGTPAMKTRLVVTTGDGVRWKAEVEGSEKPTGASAAVERERVYAFLFAWYAQHAGDTDYSAIGR